MKTIGILGGMSWESTVGYYQLINRGIQQQLGGLHSAKILIHSVDFAEFEQLQHDDNWSEIARRLTQAAQQLQNSGAELIIIATNTMHLVAEQIQQHLSVELLHIADVTGQAIERKGLKRVALLGTAFTMEKPFYKARLESKFGITVDIPNAEQRHRIHSIIYQQLCRGEIIDSSRDYFQHVISELQIQGSEGVILGCTEIGLLINQANCSAQLFDTTVIHADSAVHAMLA
jgi:aspartate racemase